MQDPHDLDSIQSLLDGATCLEEIFGAPEPGMHRVAVAVAVHDTWRRLAAITHPDRHQAPAVKAAADTLTARLNAAHELAQEAIGQGRYGEREPLGSTRPTLTTSTAKYALGEVLAHGDIATLYEARRLSDGRDVVVKMSRESADLDLMVRESRALTRLFGERAPQHAHFPELIDQVSVEGGRRANVLEVCDGLDLVELRERLGGRVPPVHATWMLRRALSALGWAHSQGVVHGNLDPAHLVVRASDHNVWLVDWCYASIDPARTGQGFVAHNPTYSPPEVLDGRPPLPASDLFALGRVVQWALGGDPVAGTVPDDVPEPLTKLLRFMTLESPLGRAQDAWRTYQRAEVARDESFGPHRFRKLDVP